MQAAPEATFSFSGDPQVSILSDMTNVTLSPEQERFAADVVASGRYSDVSEVVAAALDELQRVERHRDELLASVIVAEQEGERDGFLTGDEVAARVHATITRRSSGSA